MANWSKSCTRFRAAGVSLIPSNSAVATSSRRVPFNTASSSPALNVSRSSDGSLGIGLQEQFVGFFQSETGRY